MHSPPRSPLPDFRTATVALLPSSSPPHALLVNLLLVIALISRPALALDVPRVFADSKNSVVLIASFDNQANPLKIGSGFFVDDGTAIATNLHVVQGASSAKAKITSGEWIDIESVRGVDSEHDLVILSAHGHGKPLHLSTRQPDVGEDVIAIGNPKGLEGTVSLGIISAIRRDTNAVYLQTTAPISPGSSGGPILDARGDVLGVATFQAAEGQNLNFAMPSSYLIPLLPSRSSIAIADLPSPIQEHTSDSEIVLVKALSDGTFRFRPQLGVVVTTEFDDGLFARNLAAQTEEALKTSGIRVSHGGGGGYSLAVHPIQSQSTVSASQLLPSGSTVQLSRSKFVAVWGDKTDAINGLLFELYDMKSFRESAQRGPPAVVWRGFAVATNVTVRGHQGELINQTLSLLGKTDELAVDVGTTSPSASNPSVAPKGQWFECFPSSDLLIDEMTGTWRSRTFAGYIRTRRVLTQRFDGFVVTRGSSKFNQLSAASESAVWQLGLGALMVMDGALYTAEYNLGDERALDSEDLQKLFSLPLTIGQRATIRGSTGFLVHYEIESQGPVKTPFRSFKNCFVVRSTLEASGQTLEPERVWLCPNAGIVRLEFNTGRVDELNNLQEW